MFFLFLLCLRVLGGIISEGLEGVFEGLLRNICLNVSSICVVFAGLGVPEWGFDRFLMVFEWLLSGCSGI